MFVFPNTSKVFLTNNQPYKLSYSLKQSVYNIRKRYCATLLSFLKKMRNIEHALIFVIDHIRVCCYHDEARGFEKHSAGP